MGACVIFLIDESNAMASKAGRTATKSKADNTATAINSALGKWAQAADFDVAVVGYKSSADGTSNVGSRWSGPLVGRDFVRTSELPASPLAVEQRMRKVPGPGGMLLEQPVDFNVWYQPELGDKAPQLAAFEHCKHLLTEWAAANASAGDPPPLVIHITAGSSGDGNPGRVVTELMELDFPCGKPVVTQIHMSSSTTVPPTLFPSNRAYLKPGPQRDLFERASLVPASLIKPLKAADIVLNPNARAMIYNATMADLVRLLAAVVQHAAPAVPSTPPPAAATPLPPVELVEAGDAGSSDQETGDLPPDDLLDKDYVLDIADDSAADPYLAETSDDYAPSEPVFRPSEGSVRPDSPALVVFVLDRAVEDPYSIDLNNPCTKLQEQMGDLLEQIVKVGEGSIDVAVVSYGADSLGDVEVRDSLEGGLSGRSFARDTDLPEGAVRIDEFTEEMSNGVGGLIQIHHQRPILVEVEATSAAPPTDAFGKVAELISLWCSDNPTSAVPPIVLHLTRGIHAASDLVAAANGVKGIATPAGYSPVVYHLVATEFDHPPVSYSADEGDILDMRLAGVWQASSGLLCAEELAEERPTISPQSRGLVINGKFGLLLDAIRRSLPA